MKKYLIGFLFLLFAGAAQAQTAVSNFGVTPVPVAAKQAILVDAATRAVLMAKSADERMATSSMSKVLSMYLVFEAIKNGKLKLDEALLVSEYAWKQAGSRMFVNVGDRVKVEDLIRGVIVQSGNDAAVVLAEAVGTTESGFADLMNAKAKELGMTNSHFMNATGLPDPQHYSTARDLATLALAMIRDFPEYYHYYSEIDFTYNNIKQGNRNPLLYRNIGVDGLKTGHTEDAGYGLIASSLRDGRRFVLVVNGLSDMQARADEPAMILDWGYREYILQSVLKKGDKVAEASVQLGKEKNVSLVVESDVAVTLTHAAQKEMKVEKNFEPVLQAPIKKGQTVGKVLITAPGLTSIEVPLVAGADVQQLGFFKRMIEKLKLRLGMTQ